MLGFQSTKYTVAYTLDHIRHRYIDRLRHSYKPRMVKLLQVELVTGIQESVAAALQC